MTWGRVRDVFGKIRARGFNWLLERLLLEFRTPETVEGVYLRSILTKLYGAMLFVLFPFIHIIFWRNRKTLYYFYDLDVSPITFDIADYLVLAELERRRRGLDNLYIYIVPGRRDGFRNEGEGYEKIVDRSNRIWRLNNLVIPIFSLLPSCSGYSICKFRSQATLFRLLAKGAVYPAGYWPAFPIGLFRRPILDMARLGTKVLPIFRSPEQSLRYVKQWLDARVGAKKVVTITIRKYDYDPLRNSDISSWATFAGGLNPTEYAPIFVLDTEMAMDPVPDVLKEFLVFHQAPWNIALRSALYELAYLNLSLVHGPTELLWYNDRCRYIIFFPPGDSSQTGEEYVRANGFLRGESLPYATPLQKWVWEPDRLDVVRREFSQMCAIIENTAASSKSC